MRNSNRCPPRVLGMLDGLLPVIAVPGRSQVREPNEAQTAGDENSHGQIAPMPPERILTSSVRPRSSSIAQLRLNVINVVFDLPEFLLFRADSVFNVRDLAFETIADFVSAPAWSKVVDCVTPTRDVSLIMIDRLAQTTGLFALSSKSVVHLFPPLLLLPLPFLVFTFAFCFSCLVFRASAITQNRPPMVSSKPATGRVMSGH